MKGTTAMKLDILKALMLEDRKELRDIRQALGRRQVLIRGLGTAAEPDNLDPFPKAWEESPDITDRDIWRFPVLATAAIVIKALVILAWPGLS